MSDGGELFTVVDPAPMASSAPYTFLMPSKVELDALGPGDLVKLIFQAIPPSERYGAERMWVLVRRFDQDTYEGVLESTPEDMPLVKPGATVRFERRHIVGIVWRDASGKPEPASTREYWERCLVDNCVLYDGVPVGYLYREAPDMAGEGDLYPDSGWRIRGEYRGLSDAEIDARDCSYVALGAVLNCDDSWLALIDEPVGSAFLRDFDAGGYVREGA